METYREVDFGLLVSRDGRFYCKGKEKKVTYAFTTLGKKATARIRVHEGTKQHYFQASKLVAKAWLSEYYEGCGITYKDGDIHNIHIDNLKIVPYEDYCEYRKRNAKNAVAPIEEKKEKLRRVIKESTLTLNYLETKDFSEINAYVENHLLPILKDYCMRTLQLGRSTTEHIVCEALYCLYDCIWSGNAVVNYERWMKKVLHNWKKKGNFGYMSEGFTKVEWDAQLKEIDLSILSTKYNVKQK